MFDYTKTEIAAGGFVLVGLAVLGYLSISIGGLKLVPEKSYRIHARFANVGDLKPRAPVKVAGVTVGKVEAISLSDYLGETVLAIQRTVILPKDTIASITTAGLLGEAYVSLSPGGADQNLGQGDRITHTEPALNITDLIGRYAFGSANDKTPGGDEAKVPTDPSPSPSKEPSR